MLHPSPSAPATIWAVIPAAGVGQRALAASHHTAAPKQYQRLLGKSLLSHTLHAFAGVPAVAHTVVVIAPDDVIFPTQAENTVPRTSASAVGGASRAESVRNGLAALVAQHHAHAQDWVLVHDAARCLITPEWIERLIAACLTDTVGGLLALPLPDTLKEEMPHAPAVPAAPRVAHTVPRQGKWLAHTPQMFRLGMLQSALAQETLTHITDEASAMEQAGHAPRLVPSSAQNFKITYPEDFALAEAVLRARALSSSSPQ